MFILGVAPHQGQRRKIMSPAPAAIRVLSRRFEAISFSFISRVGNATADSLAKLALRVFALPPIRE
ncbi:hypothetical protein F2Q68_00013298 [Brassica cretica]|uniref:RNase H type-1 domain-containing protein n=1 Tax=Brassica cretica TaxID=69181 RepID=A0A8S9HMU2_BRACR|nr:hypothetical protein F2Q68_00013298 [Brassica cretica]